MNSKNLAVLEPYCENDLKVFFIAVYQRSSKQSWSIDTDKTEF